MFLYTFVYFCMFPYISVYFFTRLCTKMATFWARVIRRTQISRILDPSLERAISFLDSVLRKPLFGPG